ncbi:copper transporter [Clostridioides mangenotii]|uniref:copper transporter n=1 Tax=Metaclostridioides mangenotii TaxID=1540 RepID=UPI001C1147BB|nr:copper transporter [Clostridioides mangenotii]MBU5306615.1 copper transporter [Clostridioides mangenotii]MCR1953785.1 copper transporter [Clostridioides mangenotii]
MHINMKYYIVTIGAIFIALGIGILVGFNLNNNEQLSEQQANMINDLDEKFEILKDTNDSLKNDLSKSNSKYDKAVAYINKNVDKLIDSTLTGKTVGIITLNENFDNSEGITTTLDKTGAKIAFNIVIKDSIKQTAKLKEVSQKVGVDLSDTEGAVNYIIETLSTEDASSKLEYLQELDLIKLNYLGSSYLSYDSVILSAGDDSKNPEKDFEKLDKYLVDSLKAQNKYMVEVQNSDVTTSYVDLYSKNKVATIDNINEESGSISLSILLKQGNKIGNFGSSKTADSLIPIEE